MANVDSPFGFRYFGRQEGGSPTAGLTPRNIASTYGTGIFQGDPIISMASGYIQAATSNTVTVGGVFNGVEYLNSNVGRKIWFNSWPASGAGGNGQGYLSNDPQALFLAQSNGSPIVFADIGMNIGFATGSGNTTTGISAYSLDQSTIGTTNTLPFRIVGLWSQYAPPGSAGADDANDFNWAVVALNNTDRTSTTGV